MLSKLYNCGECSKSFETRKGLLQHLRKSFHLEQLGGEVVGAKKSMALVGGKRTKQNMESNENYDLNTLEAQMINNDDTFSDTTSSDNHGGTFYYADNKKRLINDDFSEFLDLNFPDDTGNPDESPADYDSDHFHESSNVKLGFTRFYIATIIQ